MKKPEFLFNFILIPLDFLMLIFAGLEVYFLRTSPWLRDWREVMFFGQLPLAKFLALIIPVGAAWVLIFAILGLYRVDFRKGGFGEISKVLIATTAGLTLILSFIFFRREWFESRFLIFGGWFFSFLNVSFSRLISRKIYQELLKKSNWAPHRVLLIGKEGNGFDVLRKFIDMPNLGYKLVKHLPQIDMQKIEETVRNTKIDEVILADLSYPRESIVELSNFCEEQRIGFRFAPDLFQSFIAKLEIDDALGVPILEMKRTPLEGWGRVLKRIFDILGAKVGLILSLPLWPFLAIAVKMDSKGPAIVKLKRIGRGREFCLYKFRSMVEGADKLKSELLVFNERNDGPLFKMKNDPRITRVGKILRKTRLDELPQFINVIKGEMSLVGPRPHEPEEVAKYASHHKRTFFVKPGMTGFSQISGSSDLAFEDEVKYDTFYIKNWSLFFDIKIILRTIFKLFTDKSAC